VAFLVYNPKIRDMRNIRKIIGRRIARDRKRQELSQEKLAELSGLHHNYIGAVERGDVNPGIENIYKISKALNIKLEILFKGL
jgi:transcriptional regulator with XRE-family HTH domain